MFHTGPVAPDIRPGWKILRFGLPGVSSIKCSASSVVNIKHIDGWHALIDCQCENPESLSGRTLSMLLLIRYCDLCRCLKAGIHSSNSASTAHLK